jgi:FkbM family methyltransferase
MVGESMLASAVEASVIVPAHDAAGTLGRQLQALAVQSQPPPFEVLVVANRCTDDTAGVAESFADRLRLRVVVADEMASAAYARNCGAAEAAGAYLMFCDADDQVGSDWVAGMVEPLQAGHADVVEGLIKINRDELPDWIYTWRYASFDQRCLFERDDRMPFAISASLAVRAEAFAAVGGFDTQFSGAGYEEVDLSWRLLRAGYRIGEAPDAVISYEPRRTVRGVLAQARTYARGGVMMAAKEGTLEPCPSPWVWAAAKVVVKAPGHQVVREREWHPIRVYAKSRQIYDYWLERRRWDRDRGHQTQPPPKKFDFCVKPTVPIIGGLAFAAGRLDTAAWYSEDGVEARSLAALERLLSEGDVFIDVGANIGVSTVAAAKKVGARGRVVAFEPNDRTRKLLEENVERHGVSEWVEIRSQAIGSVRGTRTFRYYENDLVSGFGVAPSTYHPGRMLQEGPVAVKPLSEWDGPVDLIKIDVEGYEDEVLEGARGLVERNPNVALLFEFNPASLRAAGRDPEQLTALLSREWDLWLVDDNAEGSADRLPPFDHERLSRQFDTDQAWYANVLATRRQ